MRPSSPRPPALDAALRALGASHPEVRDAPIAALGAGLDHEAYLAGDLVVRIAQEPGGDLAREARLLRHVAAHCEVPVPAPVAAEAAWMAYPRLEGTPLLTLDLETRARHAIPVATALGALLAALWSTPREVAIGLADVDDAPPSAWHEEAAELVAAVADELPDGARAGVERFLAAPPPPAAGTLVLSHNDLGCEHVLVDPPTGRVTGVIDWSDAAVVDPAKDLGLVLRDLGPTGLEVAVRAASWALRDDAGLRPRAAFYARCLALEDLAFGLEEDRPAYAVSALAAIARLFSDAPG